MIVPSSGPPREPLRPPSRSEPRPTFSVVVTAGARRQFLPEALACLPSSPDDSFELVVATDFHDAALEAEVARRGGLWIVSRATALGGKTADGIRAAHGSVLVFLDDDDLFHPGRLDVLRRAFQEDPDLGFYHNAQVTFPDGAAPEFREPWPDGPVLRIAPDRRSAHECERVWTLGAGYNGSSTALRREILEPHLEELARMRIGIPPYFFYRAWCARTALVMDPRPWTAVRLHASNTTPNRLQGRRARLGRLASISDDLSADAKAILGFLPQGVWDVPLRQMASMGEILAAVRGTDGASHEVAAASLELLRRRRSWLPRWTLVSLGVARLGSRRGARALYRWLAPPP